MSDNHCNRHKSKLELIIGFLRYFLRYLDRNPVEAIIFFIALPIAALTIGFNRQIGAFILSLIGIQ
jgi:hypothetical protein